MAPVGSGQHTRARQASSFELELTLSAATQQALRRSQVRALQELSNAVDADDVERASALLDRGLATLSMGDHDGRTILVRFGFARVYMTVAYMLP